jgi:WD40 repeat protein
MTDDSLAPAPLPVDACVPSAILDNCVGVTPLQTFFDIETFKYNTQFVSRSGRVKKGRKVTAIRSLPGNVNGGQDKVLVTTNDSRIRLFNLLDRSCEAKYRGHANQSSQIRASFSDDGKYIISGSEDRHVYVYDSGLSDGGSFVGWLKGRMDKGGCESFPGASISVSSPGTRHLAPSRV